LSKIEALNQPQDSLPNTIMYTLLTYSDNILTSSQAYQDMQSVYRAAIRPEMKAPVSGNTWHVMLYNGVMERLPKLRSGETLKVAWNTTEHVLIQVQ
jgi:hypothetical protein